MLGNQTKPPVVASIEARMGSSRLPGKVLMDINGVPALTRLLRRLRQCKQLDDIVVATTSTKADDAIAAWAALEAVACYRGSEEDVLQRVVEAQRQLASEVTVEITGDSILTDPAVVDLGVETFLNNECDVVTNVYPETWPMGVNVQVFRTKALAKVAESVVNRACREHVSLYFYEHPEKFRIISLTAPPRQRGAHLRWQLDYMEDLIFMREVYRRLEPMYGDAFGVDEVMQLLRSEPALIQINAVRQEKAVR